MKTFLKKCLDSSTATRARQAIDAQLDLGDYANPLVGLAIAIATAAHEGQERRYTGEPYITHPLAVARKVAGVFPDALSVTAAVLHDVVEDTDVTLDDLRDWGLGLGPFVACLVDDLTDVSRPKDGNRATRKALDRAHIARAAPRAKLIKLADLMDNTRSILEHDPDFAPTYMAEKALLLAEALQPVAVPASPLERAHAQLYAEAQAMVDAFGAQQGATQGTAAAA